MRSLHLNMFVGSKDFVLFLLFTFFSLFAYANVDGVDSLKKVLSTQKEDTSRIKTLLKIGNIYSNDNGLLDSALHYGQLAHTISENQSYLEGIAESTYLIGYTYDLMGKLDEALSFYTMASEHYAQLGDHINTHSALNGKGVACYFMGDYSPALDYFIQARDFARQHSLIREEANSLSNIGVIYRITEKYDEAIAIFKRNVTLRKELKDSTILGKVYNNLGVAYTFIDSLDQAIQYLDSCIVIYTALQDTFFLAGSHISLGDAYLKTGKNDEKARNHLEYGYSHLKKYDDNALQSKALLFLGQLESKSGSNNKAEDYFNEGLRVLEQTELDEIKRDILNAKAQNLGKMGQFSSAYQALRESYSINDSLQTEEKLKYMEEMQAKLEIENKENVIRDLDAQNQIARIRLENANRWNIGLILSLVFFGILIGLLYYLYQKNKNQRSIIQQSLVEKEDLISNLENAQDRIVRTQKMASIGQLTAGIAHEINNPINYIGNNSVALKMDLNELAPLHDLLDRIKSEKNNHSLQQELYSILSNLDLQFLTSEMAELINGIESGAHRTTEIIQSLKYLSFTGKGTVETMDIHEALDSSISVISKSSNQQITVNRNYTFDGTIKAIPGQINQLLVNIINNAFQSIDESGTIAITTSVQGKYCSIAVNDSGRGMSEETQQRLFEPFYTTREIGKGTGLGLSISYNIVQNHSGQITIESQEGQGSTITILLPIDR